MAYVCQRCLNKFSDSSGHYYLKGKGPYCRDCYTALGGEIDTTPVIVDLIKTAYSLGLRRIGLLLLPFSLGFYTLNIIVFFVTMVIESFFLKKIYFKRHYNKIQKSAINFMEFIITIISIIILIISIPNIKALIQFITTPIK